MNTTCPLSILKRGAVLAATSLVVAAGGFDIRPAGATDIEVFFTGPAIDSGDTPNVIFILDASSSMFNEVDVPIDGYDPTEVYTATGCDPDAYYFVVGSGTPSCSSPRVSFANLYCPDTQAALDVGKIQVTFADRLAERYTITKGKNKGQTAWRDLTGTGDVPIICQNDVGTPPATDIAVDWVDIGTSGITFYHPNFLAWRASQTGGGAARRIDVMKEAVLNLAANTKGINISLMRFGANNSLDTEIVNGECQAVIPTCSDPNDLECTGQSGEGLVVMEMMNIEEPDTYETIRQKLLVETVPGQGSACDVQLFTPNGRTGMATALFEAYSYYRGDPTSQSNANLSAGIGSQHNYPSVAGSRVGNTLASDRYSSPISGGCSKNYIVMLSDGTTEQDNSADNTSIKTLREPPGTAGRTFSQIVGECDVDPELADIVPTPSQCVDDLAEFMFEADARGGYGMDGIQNIKTFTIGFALDENGKENAEPLLRSTATRGGGKYYEANDAQTLQDAFDDIIRSVLTDNATFTAPAVTVDAFNRTRNLDDVYVSLFRPELRYRWQGNVKKFKVNDEGEIVDANGAPAVDPADGFLLNSSQSYWSDVVDGKDITLGGAAGEIPNWDYSAANARKVYSNLTGSTNVSLTQPSNQVSAIASYDATLARSMLGIADLATTDYDYVELVQWLYGRDVADVDADGNDNESRQDMGDPLHSRPVVLVYGGDADNPDINDSVLFVTTNDGFLQAIDTGNGRELWSFIPQQLLARTLSLVENETVDPEDRIYGLDGNVRLLIFDNNSNGIIEPDDVDGERDRALLFFGMRRGGYSYFAMDVSRRDYPKLLWVNNNLPGVGQTWSTPQPARVRTEAGDQLVLFVSGGYTPDHEDVTGTPPAWQQYPNPDDAGNRIYMLDMFSGALLWNAGPSGSDADLELPDMKHAFAADVRVLELTADGYADRLYAADLGGKVWRFDIFNGRSLSGSTEGDRLIEGGLFASLGNYGDGSPATTATRRFFYAPDAVPFELYGRSIVNIGLGSGHRELPASDTETRNGFFSIRDYLGKTLLLSSQYLADCTGASGPCHQVVTEDDLVDLTTIVGQAATDAVPDGSPGWKIWLSTQHGEKVLAEARTLGGKVFFTTYEPTPGDEYFAESCAFNFGKNRLYVVSIVDARPYYPREGELNTDTDGDGEPDSFVENTSDRSSELTQTGIASEVVFIFTDQLVQGSTSGERTVFCLAGFTSCPPGLSVEPVRTFWRQRGVQ